MSPASRPLNVLVYCDANMNLIDGSSVWTQSTALALAYSGLCNVTLLLRDPIETDRLLQPLFDAPGLNVVSPFDAPLLPDLSGSLSPRQLRRIIDSNALSVDLDIVLIRGLRLAIELIKSARLYQLWTYLTDIPQTADVIRPSEAESLELICSHSDVMLCQTESLRSLIEQISPDAVGKSWLFPPMIPEPETQRVDVDPGNPVKLVYSGKFATKWNTLKMTRLPLLCQERGINAELSMVGDKILRNPADRGYTGVMLEALENSQGVVWHGGMSRSDALDLCSRSDVGLSWRSQEMSVSRELSTKVLEYSSLGLPVILNRTPIHEHLLGADYPLFAESIEDVTDCIEYVVRNPTDYRTLSVQMREVARPFLMSNTSDGIVALLHRQFPFLGQAPAERTAVCVMSHDFKFFTRIQDHLVGDPGLEVTVDEWPALDSHDDEATLAAMDKASVVICEWCGPNAVFASSHVRDGQRLLIRLHRFELETDYPGMVDIDAVDKVITVSPYYRNLTIERTRWPSGKVVVIPNWVDVSQLRRSKIGDVRHNLGMIGIAPRRKRFDRALDVLADLRADDPRYHLFVKSKMPWDYWFIWNDPVERSHYAEAFRRMQRDANLQGAVTFDPFGPDVARWLQKIGYVLSTSDDESFHLAPAEGMASGAVPAITGWAGADTIYDERWIAADSSALAVSIAEQYDEWADLSTEAQVEAMKYDLPIVTTMWSNLIHGKARELAMAP